MKIYSLLCVALLSHLLLPASAAIDDQGMQYVSAAEGLHGSLRVIPFRKTNIRLRNLRSADFNEGTIIVNPAPTTETTPPAGTTTTAPILDETNLSGGQSTSLRLWITGSADLGNGVSSTYYYEMRGDGDEDNSAISTYAWDLGFSAPWGELAFGRLDMVAERMVPSASLAYEFGSDSESFACAPCDNGLRYESPSFDGFRVGVSAISESRSLLAGDGTIAEDGLLIDEYSLAFSYKPARLAGLEIGAGYEVLRKPDTIDYNDPATFQPSLIDNKDANQAADMRGGRAGVRYGVDGWLFAYEYRAYKGFDVFANSFISINPVREGRSSALFDASRTALPVVVRSGFPGTLDTRTQLTLTSAIMIDLDGDGTLDDVSFETVSDTRVFIGIPLTELSYNKKLSYDAHAFGVKKKFGRYTVSANFSWETQAINIPAFKDLDWSSQAVDIAYALGSNSNIVIGFKNQLIEEYELGLIENVADTTLTLLSGPPIVTYPFPLPDQEITALFRPARFADGEIHTNRVNEIYLFYRVDF